MSEDQAQMLRALHDEHSSALWRFVLRLTGDRHLAEDVVQEALLRAWKHPEILAQGEAAARSWLYTVARNLVIDDRRSAVTRGSWAPRRSPSARLPTAPTRSSTPGCSRTPSAVSATTTAPSSCTPTTAGAR